MGGWAAGAAFDVISKRLRFRLLESLYIGQKGTYPDLEMQTILSR